MFCTRRLGLTQSDVFGAGDGPARRHCDELLPGCQSPPALTRSNGANKNAQLLRTAQVMRPPGAYTSALAIARGDRFARAQAAVTGGTRMDQRYEAVVESLRGAEAIAVAFSGGVDSTLLLACAAQAVGAERVLALTAVTPYMVRQEIGDAVALASELGVQHDLVEMDMPSDMEDNPPDRCYRCKHRMYALLAEHARVLGYPRLLDASNVDDADSSRPALRAVRELGIGTPFIAHGIDKEAVRVISRALKLPTWQKPSNACLLTRLRHNHPVSMRELQRIEEAERHLQSLDFESVRVRSHGNLARIEVAPSQRMRLMEQADDIGAALRALGFRHISVDLFGYHHGSMDEPGD
jgi:pyridinium-3,5-biscarboxylic acid mononucleotide sulfurtransferase